VRRLPCLLLLTLCLSGCATLPQGVALEDDQRREIVAGFRAALAARNGAEISCLDAEAAVTVQAWFRSGVINGYLQAQSPAELKFVGLDPLGRPLLALVTDGDSFRLAQVAEAKIYEGNTAAAGFRRYLPAGIDPAALFAWLTGHPPLERAAINEVIRDHEGRGYWLDLTDYGSARDDSPSPRLRVLFAPESGLIRQVLLLDQEGRPKAEIGYHDYRSLATPDGPSRLLPHRLEVISRQGRNGTIAVTLAEPSATCRFAAEEFRLRVPPGFELVQVNHGS